jgi:hypothetical protein
MVWNMTSKPTIYSTSTGLLESIETWGIGPHQMLADTSNLLKSWMRGVIFACPHKIFDIPAALKYTDERLADESSTI